MAQVLRFQRLGTLDAPVPPDQALDVGRGAVTGDHEQILFVVRRRDPGHGADLGEADPAGAKRLADKVQILEGVGYPDFLAGGAHSDAALPVQPVGARVQARACPALTLVELAYERQEAVGGGGDVRGQFGDVVFQVLQVRVGGIDGENCG